MKRRKILEILEQMKVREKQRITKETAVRFYSKEWKMTSSKREELKKQLMNVETALKKLRTEMPEVRRIEEIMKISSPVERRRELTKLLSSVPPEKRDALEEIHRMMVWRDFTKSILEKF